MGINGNVRIYLNAGFYAKKHASWASTSVPKPDGLVVVANRPKSCTATLAVVCEGAALSVNTQPFVLGSTKPGHTVTFYIAPGLSYETNDPAAAAWTKADTARKRGYDAVRKETAQWWKEFYAKSAVQIPPHEKRTFTFDP